MKLSKSFWQTYKEVPVDAEIPSHQLMMRAGLIQKSAAGIYNYLPFGYRTIRKVEQIIREEMDAVGSNEILMSVITPGELWKESGRWDSIGGEMLKFKDKADRDLCISPTNEETVTDIFRKTIKSYKQLPTSLYQINTKFRDEIRPRFGLMRGREFIMKDAYTFHIDKDSLDQGYDELHEAYQKCFTRMGLKFSVVEADAGAMGSRDSKSHEFQAIADTGEDELIFCEKTGYAANREKAATKRAELIFDTNDSGLEKIDTKNMATIEEVCNFLNKPQHHSLKSLVYTGIVEDKEQHVLIMMLGDDSLNEVKLKNYLGVNIIAPAKESTLLSYGLPKGFIGPYGLKKEIRIIFDKAISLDDFYVTGALEIDKHFTGYCPKRDCEKFDVADLRMAQKGDLTEDGAGHVDIKRGIEVGHIFQLGDKYTKAMGTKVLDNNGKTVAPLMGCYGMGVTRIVGAAIEQNHDEKGIIWPKALAPYDIYFALVGKSEEIVSVGDEVYKNLKSAGFDTIFDDRKAGAGFKFKDADLLGLPLRVVLGERDFKNDGTLEIVVRKTGEKHIVKKDELLKKVKELWETI